MSIGALSGKEEFVTKHFREFGIEKKITAVHVYTSFVVHYLVTVCISHSGTF